MFIPQAYSVSDKQVVPINCSDSDLDLDVLPY